MKKKIIIGVLLIISIVAVFFVSKYIHKQYFYYKLVDFHDEKYYSISLRGGSFVEETNQLFDVCETDQNTLFKRTLCREDIEEFNRNIVDKRIVTKMDGIIIAQQFAEFLYKDGCKHQQPFMIQYIEKHNTWVVIGDILQRTWYKDLYYKLTRTYYNINGGELCVVIDADTGNILFMDNTV